MQAFPYYDDVISEIKEFLEERIAFALSSGIKKENIVIDPGVGFGKRVEDNIAIIRHAAAFKGLGQPLLIGVSRKSTIAAVTGASDMEERLAGTIALNVLAIDKGADIIRVHDVIENKRAALLADMVSRRQR